MLALFEYVPLKHTKRRFQGPDGKTLRISGQVRLNFELNGQESVEDLHTLPLLCTAPSGKPFGAVQVTQGGVGVKH